MIRLFILFTCLTLICSNVAALHFTILPDVTSELADDIVDMNCSLGTQQVTSLYSIKIVKDGQSSPLATILTENRTIVHDPSNYVAVNGHIATVAPDTSYLHLRWSHPTFKNSGVYTCEITYLDLTENTTNSSKSVAELTVKRIDMHDIVRAFHHVHDQTAERDEEIKTLRQENKNRDSQIKFLVNENKDLHKSLTERDSQFKTNSQLLKDMREILNNVQKKSVEMESITDATRKVLLENTNSLKGHDQRLNTVLENFNKLTKTVNKLIDVHKKFPDRSWKKFRINCFKHIKETKTWLQARDHCKSLNGNLPEIPDAQTNAFIFAMIKETKEDVWIGLKDLTSEGGYVWDGSSWPVSSYTNWRSFGRPDTYINATGYHYGFMSRYFGGTWLMARTKATNWFICQKATVSGRCGQVV